MIHYYILMDKNVHIERMKGFIGKQNVISSFHTVTELHSALKGTEGESIILLGELSTNDPYLVCQEITYHYPQTAVVLLLPDESIDLKKAMYSGAVDAVNIYSDQECVKAIEKAREIVHLKSQRFPQEEPTEGKVITVCSTKGGVGKTTISVNLAVACMKKNLKVAVIDLDLQFGDVPLLFDQKPKKTIYEWMKEGYDEGSTSLEGYLTKDETGIEILASPHLPEYAELVTGEHIYTIIQEMKKTFDVIIIDTPPSFVETSLVALENSDEILLITSLDLPSLKNGKLALDTLGILGLKDRIKVILNRDTESAELTTDMIEKVLGLPIKQRIPSDYKLVISSINKGDPFVSMSHRSPVAKSVLALADELIERPKQKEVTKKKTSFWKSITRKK
ncbi:AAA family ATPase [Bacillus sp. JJ1533]|uniref:AAA family ATPase n=1 Tax=Bacillus sp. JJ1533 TaxID=3122959 RepID=UPI002FFDDAD7